MVAVRGDRVKERREARKLSQGQLTAFSGVSQSYISVIEGGKRDDLGVGSKCLAALAKVLDTSVDYLAGTSDDPRPPEGLGIDASPMKRRMIAMVLDLDDEKARAAESYLEYLQGQ